jgi:NADPH:quinone reductase-like Zn-dependent oxidoreductase
VPNGGNFGNRWLAGGARVIQAHLVSRFVRQTLRPFLLAPTLDDLLTLKAMVEAGDIVPVVDRAYPLAETAQAIAHVGEGHARGKVAITVARADLTLRVAA